MEFWACCFDVARAWWTSSQILFSKNSCNHGEDVAFHRNFQGKYTAHNYWGCGWDRNEKWNQEIMEGRQLQRASGQLIIELIRGLCSPNNTWTNHFKSGLGGKWGHHLHDLCLPHKLQIQMKYYEYYFNCTFIIYKEFFNQNLKKHLTKLQNTYKLIVHSTVMMRDTLNGNRLISVLPKPYRLIFCFGVQAYRS